MRRLAVIAITVCTTLAVTVAAEYAWLSSHTVQTSQGVLKVDRHGVRLDLPVRIGRICFERLP